MAKKMKRLLALLLALALVGGQMILPAMATEEPNTQITENAEEPKEEKSAPEADSAPAPAAASAPAPAAAAPAPAPAEAPASAPVAASAPAASPEPVASQTTSSYTDPGTGATVTVTQTQVSDPGTGTSSSSTTTESVLVSGDGTRTDVNTTWQNTEVQTGSDTQGTNPVTTTDTNITTQVSGSENITQTDTYDADTGIETVTGQMEGQETTTITGTTVTTTTETGVITGNETVTEDTRTEEREGTTSTTDNDFTAGTASDTGWKDSKIQEGGKTGETTSTGSETIRPEHEGDVTLDLKPDEKWVTKTYDIGLEDLAKVPAGATVTEKKDKSGKVTGWTVTHKEKVSTTDKPTGADVTEGSWEAVGQESSTYINPGNYTVGTTIRGDDLNAVSNGETVTTKVEEIYVDGVYEGYRIITTTTTKVTGEATDEEVGKRTDAEYEKVEGDVLDAGYTMPEEPTAGTTNNADGTVTTVSYTLIEEEGQPRGYAITTEIRDAEGKLIRTENRNIYGTSHTSQTTVETDPTAERTTTTTLTTRTDVQEIRTTETTRNMEKVDNRVQTYETTIVKETDTYELIATDAGTFFLYQGKMYRVEAIGSHGQADVQTLVPDSRYVTASSGSDLRNKNGTTTGLFSNYSNAGSDSFPGGYEFRYVGNGAASTLQINYDGGSTSAHQFALRDSDGNLHYVYCCDLDTSAVRGTYYEIENLKDAGYYSTASGSDIVDHIRTVATNGFWATSGGKNDTGTLAAVKQLLKDYDKYFPEDLTAVANSLTEGEALSATQAALWAFGNKGTTPNEKDIVSYYKTNGYASNATDERNVLALYKLLISDRLKDATKDTSTDLIDKEDITGSKVTIHGKATYDDGSVKTSGGNTVYNTDVSFQLNVSKSSITGNLVVKVVQNGKVIRTEQIATDDSNFVGKLLAGKESNGTTSYTIKDLELIEGVRFTLNLEGTQDMEEGVYLYTAKGGNTASQTFVGVAAGERDVDLEVDLVFQVADPEVKHTNKVITVTREDTQKGTRTSSRTDKKVNTETRTSGVVKTDVSHDIDIVSTVTTTETKQDITREDRSWKAYLEYLLKRTSGDEDGGGEDGGGEDGGDEDGGRRRGTTILDEEVPLADAPRTGDISGLWAAVSALSLAGAAYLSIKRREEEI